MRSGRGKNHARFERTQSYLLNLPTSKYVPVKYPGSPVRAISPLFEGLGCGVATIDNEFRKSFHKGGVDSFEKKLSIWSGGL